MGQHSINEIKEQAGKILAGYNAAKRSVSSRGVDVKGANIENLYTYINKISASAVNDQYLNSITSYYSKNIRGNYRGTIEYSTPITSVSFQDDIPFEFYLSFTAANYDSGTLAEFIFSKWDGTTEKLYLKICQHGFDMTLYCFGIYKDDNLLLGIKDSEISWVGKHDLWLSSTWNANIGDFEWKFIVDGKEFSSTPVNLTDIEKLESITVFGTSEENDMPECNKLHLLLTWVNRKLVSFLIPDYRYGIPTLFERTFCVKNLDAYTPAPTLYSSGFNYVPTVNPNLPINSSMDVRNFLPSYYCMSNVDTTLYVEGEGDRLCGFDTGIQASRNMRFDAGFMVGNGISQDNYHHEQWIIGTRHYNGPNDTIKIGISGPTVGRTPEYVDEQAYVGFRVPLADNTNIRFNAVELDPTKTYTVSTWADNTGRWFSPDRTATEYEKTTATECQEDQNVLYKNNLWIYGNMEMNSGVDTRIYYVIIHDFKNKKLHAFVPGFDIGGKILFNDLINNVTIYPEHQEKVVSYNLNNILKTY